MPLVKSKRIKHIKYKEDSGNIIEIKLWQVKPSIDKPHGYKYSLVYIVNGRRVIGYDNSEGKGDHRHYEGKEGYYQFTTVRELIKEFFKNVEKYKKGGK